MQVTVECWKPAHRVAAADGLHGGTWSASCRRVAASAGARSFRHHEVFDTASPGIAAQLPGRAAPLASPYQRIVGDACRAALGLPPGCGVGSRVRGVVQADRGVEPTCNRFRRVADPPGSRLNGAAPCGQAARPPTPTPVVDGLSNHSAAAPAIGYDEHATLYAKLHTRPGPVCDGTLD